MRTCVTMAVTQVDVARHTGSGSARFTVYVEADAKTVGMPNRLLSSRNSSVDGLWEVRGFGKHVIILAAAPCG